MFQSLEQQITMFQHISFCHYIFHCVSVWFINSTSRFAFSIVRATVQEGGTFRFAVVVLHLNHGSWVKLLRGVGGEVWKFTWFFGM